MKYSVLALLGFASAAESNFPSFDALHAHCQMTTTFNDTCDNVYTSLDTAVKSFKDPASGIYAVKEEGANQYVWVTRTTPTKHYVDDIIFETNSAADGSCSVVSKSRSQTTSYYDYDTNFCNMYNVFRGQAITFTAPTTQDCKWVPEDIATTCDKY